MRLVFPNPDRALKPNLFADVTTQGAPREALSIPREALIATGERESVVKALGEGRFQPVDVVTGMRSGEAVEVLSGLAEGDAVVVSGQFLIDSESSLQASFGRLTDPQPPGPSAATPGAALPPPSLESPLPEGEGAEASRLPAGADSHSEHSH